MLIHPSSGVAAPAADKNAFQASLTTLATLEARHDYAGWRKYAQSLFAPNALVTTVRPTAKTTQTFSQYLAAEQRNMALTAAARATIEHDYVQSFQLLPARQAAATSELTTHTHEPVENQLSSVDYVIERDYTLQQQSGAWRILRLSVTMTSLSVNGKSLGLVKPVHKFVHQ